MNDVKKLSRWPKMLDEAGLLDEIDGDWDLTGVSDLDGATIEIDGVSACSDTPISAADLLVAENQERTEAKLPVQEKNESAELSRTPVERIRSSVPDVVKAKPSSPGPPMFVSNARATMEGIPITPSKLPSKLPSVAPSGISVSVIDSDTSWENLATKEILVESESEDKIRERVENIRSSGIAIAPESVELNIEASDQSIVDEPRLNPVVSQAKQDLHEKLRQHHELGDFSGTIGTASLILKQNPNDAIALELKKSSQEILMKMYESRIGPFDNIPTLAIAKHELTWRNMDSSSGFVLSLIDGMISYEDIIDISGLSLFETCRIINQLLQDSIIK